MRFFLVACWLSAPALAAVPEPPSLEEAGAEARGLKFERAAQAPAPVFPEDGSLRMAAWYAGRGQSWAMTPEVADALKSEGVALKRLAADYDWIQDLALFASDGTLLLMAEMPNDEEILSGLTMGVLDGDGYLRTLCEADAKAAGLKFRRLAWTFVEGGELVTGRLKNGEGYAALDAKALDRTRAFHKWKTKRDVSQDEAKALVAADLGVKPENLLAVRARQHLDLDLFPLPGGVMLVHDPSRALDALRAALAKAPEGEKERLRGMIGLHEKGHQRRYAASAGGGPMGEPLFPFDPADQKTLDAMAGALSGKLTVVRAAGVFPSLELFANSDDSFYIDDGINFFNGFAGLGADGVFTMTNSARGLTALESHWRGILKDNGVAPERVHFPGRYRGGAGLDCSGAGAP